MVETDVLIVGAGPTGLTLAVDLRRRGVACRIIDRAAEPPETSRALGVQPRTLEVFEALGMVDAVLRAGGPLAGADVHDAEGPILSLTVSGVETLHTRHPRTWLVPQTVVEGALAARLRDLGGAVERGRALAGLVRDPAGARVTIDRAGAGDGGEETVRARWVVGCDGARSTVRRLLGIAFAGTARPESWVIADVVLEWDRPMDRAQSWFSAGGVFGLFPMPGFGLWRVITPAPPGVEPTPDLVRRLLRERTGGAAVLDRDPVWVSGFTIQRRLAARYRADRCFLAGDAAHVHSPAGGQGMNTGIQDAANLGWKLALAIEGRSGSWLLDSYEQERRPVAKAVLAGTDAATAIVVSRNPLVRALRDRAFAHPAVRAHANRHGSQLLVGYRRTPLAPPGWTWAPRTPRAWLAARASPRPGDRAPDADLAREPAGEPTTLHRELARGWFSLLAFVGPDDGATIDAGTAAGLLVRRHPRVAPIAVRAAGAGAAFQSDITVLRDPGGAAHRRYGVPAGGFVLVRPDGYVACRAPLGGGERIGHFLRLLFDGLGA